MPLTQQLVFHCSLSTVSRRKGQFATRKAAYNSGSLLRDERTGQTFDFRFKPVLHQALILADGISLGGLDRFGFWNQVEFRELRWDARVAREFKVSLPCVLDQQQNLTLLERFALYISRELHTPVDLALHPASKRGDRRNIHGHLLFPTREWEDGALGAKHRKLDDRYRSGALLTKFRQEFARLTNEALLKAEKPYLVDHRSYWEQGIEKAPGKHHGPKRWWLMKRIQEELHALEAEELDLLREEAADKVLSTEDIYAATAEIHQWSSFFRGERDAPDSGAFSMTGDRSLDLTPEFAALIKKTERAFRSETSKGSESEKEKAAIRLTILEEFQALVVQAQLFFNELGREEDREQVRDVA